MSSPSNSANSTSESESEASEIEYVVDEIVEFAQYDESVEPLATEEAAAYNELEPKNRCSSSEDICKKSQLMNGMVIESRLKSFHNFSLSS